mgnify:CR=1 FL=1
MSRENNSIIEVNRTVGDTEPSIGLQLLRENSSEQLAVFDLTDYTMTYLAINAETGATYISETDDNISKTDGENGKVSIDVTALAVTAGEYWVWVIGTHSGGDIRQWPHDGKRLKVVINAKAA